MKKDDSQILIEENLDHYSDLDLFIENENHCCLCGSDLEFIHTFNYMEQSLVEEALCGHCQIKTREKEFTLH